MEPLEPTSSSNEELPRRNLKAVGPMGWSANQGGRPATQLGPPTFPFFHWAVLWAHLSMGCVLTSVTLVFFSDGPSNPFNACVAIFDWSVFALWPKRV